MMESNEVLTLMLAIAVSGGLVWGCSRWYYERQLKASLARVDKLDKAREFALQQGLQARRQIDKMQRQLDSQQLLMTQSQLAQQRLMAMKSTLRDAELDALARQRASHSEPPDLPPTGFADTQTMEQPQQRQ